MKAMLNGNEPLQITAEDFEFVDRWFANEMNRLVEISKKHYETMCYREALRTCYFEFTKTFDQYRDVCKSAKRNPSESLVMRYFEWQLIILSPICPHFCEHAWGSLGKSGSVLDARFPSPTAPVVATIVAQGQHIYDKVPHDLIKLCEKASKAARPSLATVYVARDFPEWKVLVLSLLRDFHARGKLPLVTQDALKDDEAAKGDWKDVMQALMQEPSLKSVAKHVGPFAAFKRDEAAQSGICALDAALPFDEMALLAEHVEYLQDKLRMPVILASSAEPVEPDHKDAASTAQPGKPAVHYKVDSNSVAPGSIAASGGKATGSSKPSSAKPSSGHQSSTITDMKKLDEYLSARSYYEAGPGPTEADVAQFMVTPANVDAEQFPHVVRWYHHISFFTPAQWARW